MYICEVVNPVYGLFEKRLVKIEMKTTKNVSEIVNTEVVYGVCGRFIEIL